MAMRRVFSVKPVSTTGELEVQVVDDLGHPVPGAYVSVYPLGAGLEADADGRAAFDALPPGPSAASALKAGYGPDPEGDEGPVRQDVEITAGEQAQLTLTVQRMPRIITENILLVGSELHYRSFPLKMMFVAPAFAVVSQGQILRTPDKTTILLVDAGYSSDEKDVLQALETSSATTLVPITDVAQVAAHFNAGRAVVDDGVERTKTRVQDVAIFCHGFPHKLALNLSPSLAAGMDFTATQLKDIHADVFVPHGRIFSYACRTGASKDAKEFANDAEAGPENSLAQKLADHFGVDVFAFLTRTWYGEVLTTGKAELATLSDTLARKRAAAAGDIVDLSLLHEALPHPGLGGGKSWLTGTGNYALWRKPGAVAMPCGHDTPAGLTREMRHFVPYR